MLTTADALAEVLAASPDFPAESVTVAQAPGRVLRQPVIAERDQPPFDRVMMDGVTISYSDYANGARSFPLQATQAAGDPALSLEAGKSIEIMTGAALPANADCVVPVERIAIENGTVTFEDDYVPEQHQYIHPRASDHSAGTELLRAGRIISPLDIAVIASAGLTDIEVSRAPVIRVISTGNELVPAGEPIEAHQIRMSNGPAIAALLGTHGYHDCEQDHIEDEPAVLRERIGAHLEAADVLVLSGGVSMGKADFVPEVLTELGVEMVFHKVAQRPGKPMWFGVGPNGQAVFALPGNPVSALVCCRQYVIPALARSCNMESSPPAFASLAGDVTFKPELTCFQPIKLFASVAGQALAMPVKTNTSGDFTALAATDGYVELPSDTSEFPAGTPVMLHRW